MALPDEEFHAELEQRFKLHLGELTVIGARRAHPLGFFVARSFIGRSHRACWRDAPRM